MENARVTNRRLLSTKEVIDKVYEKTRDGGIVVAFNYSSAGRAILSILRKRQVLIRIKTTLHKPCWTWNPSAMAPTDNFYKSVAQEVANQWSKYYSDRKKERAEVQAATSPAPSTKIFPANSPGQSLVRSKIVEFSDQELWDELARRGFTIEDNHIVKRVVLI